MPRKEAANSQKTASRPPTAGSFKPGQSGNPNGRPKQTQEQKDALAAIRALAPKAAEIMAEILADAKAPPAVRVKVANDILDRTYGKPEATVHIDGDKARMVDDIRAAVERIKAGGAG